MDYVAKAKELSSFLHGVTRDMEVSHRHIDYYYKRAHYRISVFNDATYTPSRVVFLKREHHSFTCSITVYEFDREYVTDRVLCERGEAIASFLSYLSRNLLLQQLFPHLEKQRWVDSALDRYNKYLTLYHLFGEERYKEKAERILSYAKRILKRTTPPLIPVKEKST